MILVDMRYAVFSFQIHVVHDVFIYGLILTKETTLVEHLIHKCGFSTMKIGSDSDVFVTNILFIFPISCKYLVFFLNDSAQPAFHLKL